MQIKDGTHSGNIVLLVAVLCAVACTGYAQSMTDTLDEVSIRRYKKQYRSPDDRINTFSPGQKVITIDSLVLQRYRLQSVANMLSQQTPVFIKSYGFNGLTTLNFRGSSAAQSQVYWNGVPMTNASLGLADVSAIPVAFVNRVNIVYGGSAALLGSGNVGGALMLESDLPVFDTVAHLRGELLAGAGSFGQYQLGAKADYRTKRWYVSANSFFQTARNDFGFTAPDGGERRNTNSGLNGAALLSQIAYKADDINTFRLAAWYQDYYREIPPALFESVSAKKRDDRSLRLLFNWDHTTKRQTLYARTAFMQDRMRYEDSLSLLYSTNRSMQVYEELGWKRRLGWRHHILVFVPVHISWMPVSDITKYQSKYALAAAYRYTDIKQRLEAALNLRGELINERSILLPGINASYVLTDWIKLRGNVQRTFRAPSLNELYYAPGGNPDLRPEEGWSVDAGYGISFKPVRRFSVQHDLSFFNREIHDWIIWYGGAIWTPHNIATVRSRGIETEYLFTYELRRCQLRLGINGAYVAATTRTSYVQNDGSVGKQIPYTPRFVGQLNAGFVYKGFSLNYNYCYTGMRYINADETGALDAYQVSNMQLGYMLMVKKKSLQLFLQGNNILNERYVVVASRVMPELNWLLGIKLAKL